MSKVISVICMLLVSTVVISSCCKKRRYCDAGQIDFAIVGYERIQSRHIVLKKYAIGGIKPLDSGRYVYNGNRPDTFDIDTLYFADYTTVDNRLKVTAGNDWEIHIPGAGRVFKISEIIESDNRYEMVRCGDDETKCNKQVTGYLMNGQWLTTSFIFIR